MSVGGVVEQAARPQFLFRDVNDWIAGLSGDVMYDGAKLFVCECSRDDCAEAVEATLAEYETVRRHGARFIVLEGHELAGIENVVERTARFVVVEKVET